MRIAVDARASVVRRMATAFCAFCAFCAVALAGCRTDADSTAPSAAEHPTGGQGHEPLPGFGPGTAVAHREQHVHDKLLEGRPGPLVLAGQEASELVALVEHGPVHALGMLLQQSSASSLRSGARS